MSLTIETDELAETVSAKRARNLRERIVAARAAGSNLVIGVPAGRTLTPMIEALRDQLRENPIALDGLLVILMDDYALRSGDTWRAPDVTAHYSCRRFGEWMIAELSGAVAPLAGISEDHLWSPSPADPASYDEAIESAGGIDIFYVAVGASDGHIAFNPPGSALNSRTRIIPLAVSTRTDNLRTFPDFASLDEVPTHGVSVGIATIAGAREIEMLAFGEGKAEAVRRVLHATDFDIEWPASFVHIHSAARLFLDREAAALIPAPTGTN